MSSHLEVLGFRLVCHNPPMLQGICTTGGLQGCSMGPVTINTASHIVRTHWHLSLALVTARSCCRNCRTLSTSTEAMPTPTQQCKIVSGIDQTSHASCKRACRRPVLTSSADPADPLADSSADPSQIHRLICRLIQCDPSPVADPS